MPSGLKIENIVWPWAVDMDKAELELVNDSLIQRTFERGAYVCLLGSRADYWYGVVDGLVKMSSTTPEGKDLSFIGIASGGWFGEGTILKQEKRKYDIIALRDSHLALMPQRTFLSLIETSPSFSKWLLFQLNERLSQFIALLANDRSKSNNARVARVLAWMFNPYLYPGMLSNISITQDEIAHLANISRSRTNQALHALEAAGLIRVGYRSVNVIDIEGLRGFEDEA
jgi:CRP-like cAMP-binding protein